MYTRATNDLNKSHNRAMAHLNLMKSTSGQHMALKKVCSELGLKFGRCKEHAMSILDDKGITDSSQQDINKTLDKLEEEHHAVKFVYKTDRKRYGKYLEQVEKDLLQHKDPFPKTIADMSRILAGWKGKYNGRYYKITHANDSVAFATMSEKENNKNHKKKETTCYKCKKTGH